MKQRIKLDTVEIDRLVERLNNYADSLADLTQEFVKRLADIGINVVDMTYGKGLGDSSKDHHCTFQFDELGNVVKGRIIVTGEDILFVEFGAGIYFNNGNTHPKAHELGYGVGSYPNQTHAYDPNGWYYRDEDNSLHHSLGTEATMPVYKASIEMITRVEEVAKEVFSGQLMGDTN